MFIGITKWKPTFPTLVVLLIMAGACSDDEGSSQPQVPNPGNIEITIETDGKDEDPDGYVLLVDGSSMETDPNGTYLVENKSPGSYSVELTEVPSHCEGEGEMVRQVTVTEDGTVQVAYKVTCKAILRNKILFAIGTGGFQIPYGIYSMDYNGENRKLIFDENLNHTVQMQVSSDGTTIYFVGRIYEDNTSAIYKIDADGDNVEELLRTNFIAGISLSSDGTQLAYSAQNEIYKMDLSTKETQNITSGNRSRNRFPVWFEEDNKILFSRTYNSGGDGLYEMRTDGSEQQEVKISNSDKRYHNSRFSPDENMIAITITDPTDFYAKREIHIMDVEGENRINISEKFNDPDIDCRAPEWSSDGNLIVFNSRISLNSWRVNVYDRSLNQISQLTEESSTIYVHPIFSPIMR